MTLDLVVANRLHKIKNELGRGKRRWKKLDKVMNKIRLEYPITKDWDAPLEDKKYFHPYESVKEFREASWEISKILFRQIDLDEENRYLHDLVRRGKK